MLANPVHFLFLEVAYQSGDRFVDSVHSFIKGSSGSLIDVTESSRDFELCVQLA